MQRASHFRRRLIIGGGLGVTAMLSGGLAAAAGLIVTPRQSTGPFYPETIPLDSDNDLVQVEGRPAPAAGKVAHVFGRVMDENSQPLSGVKVEIWQCDAFGRYHHPRDRGGGADPNFQGYGQMRTGDNGAYRFRTIEPVPYPGRTPHIHFALSGPRMETLVTQMYLRGHPLNAKDWIYNSVRDAAARESLAVAFAPAADLEPEAVAGTFDIVIAADALRS